MHRKDFFYSHQDLQTNKKIQINLEFVSLVESTTQFSIFRQTQ